jgi:hypothetical protein
MIISPKNRIGRIKKKREMGNPDNVLIGFFDSSSPHNHEIKGALPFRRTPLSGIGTHTLPRFHRPRTKRPQTVERCTSNGIARFPRKELAMTTRHHKTPPFV